MYGRELAFGRRNLQRDRQCPSGIFFVLPIVILTLMGFTIPSAWVSQMALNRQTSIRKALPDTMDLLTISVEAGLGFAVDLKKPGGFIGKEAVLAKKAAGPLTKRLLQVLVKDPEPMLFHAEVVRRNGRPVGYVRAEIEFQQGVVTRWRTLPKPPN